MRLACKIVGFSILLFYSGAFASGEEPEKAPRSWDDYKIITQRNIFSRYRTKAVPMSQVQEQVLVVPEQSYYTLRGITKQSDGYISFIEDSRTVSVTRFRKGDSIADGRVTEIDMDHISYENGGKDLSVEIGMNLEGHVSGAGMQYLSSGSGRTQPNGEFSGIAQSRGMGQQGPPGGVIGQAEGQFQGRGQEPAMGQFQPTGQGSDAGQSQSIGQVQGMGQREAARTTQPAGQSGPAMQLRAPGQSQTGGQAGATGQLQTIVDSSGAGQAEVLTVQPVTGAQQEASDSDDIMQRLKERRKKELE